MANQRADNKENIMFWVDGKRKARFVKACKGFNISMTDSFDRLIDAVILARAKGEYHATIDLHSEVEMTKL